MNREEFIAALARGLAEFPAADRRRFCDYYREMIDDRMEEGMDEEEAVSAMGDIDTILRGIYEDNPPPVKRKRPVWETVLLAAGAPLWLALLITAGALLFTFFAVLWALVAVCFAVALSLGAGAIAGPLAAFGLFFTGQGVSGLLMLGGGIFCIGVTLFAFHGSLAAVRGGAALSGRILRAVTSCFERRRKG